MGPIHFFYTLYHGGDPRPIEPLQGLGERGHHEGGVWGYNIGGGRGSALLGGRMGL